MREPTDGLDCLPAEQLRATVRRYKDQPQAPQAEVEAIHTAAFKASQGEPYDCSTWRATEVYELVEALREKVADTETVWIRFDPLRPNRVPRTWGALRKYCAAREASNE